MKQRRIVLRKLHIQEHIQTRILGALQKSTVFFKKSAEGNDIETASSVLVRYV